MFALALGCGTWSLLLVSSCAAPFCFALLPRGGSVSPGKWMQMSPNGFHAPQLCGLTFTTVILVIACQNVQTKVVGVSQKGWVQ